MEQLLLLTRVIPNDLFLCLSINDQFAPDDDDHSDGDADDDHEVIDDNNDDDDATYSGDKFKGLSTVVPRALNQSAVVQEESVVSYNLKHNKHFKCKKNQKLTFEIY